jgi:hypothetical protein
MADRVNCTLRYGMEACPFKAVEFQYLLEEHQNKLTHRSAYLTEKPHAFFGLSPAFRGKGRPIQTLGVGFSPLRLGPFRLPVLGVGMGSDDAGPTLQLSASLGLRMGTWDDGRLEVHLLPGYSYDLTRRNGAASIGFGVAFDFNPAPQ